MLNPVRKATAATASTRAPGMLAGRRLYNRPGAAGTVRGQLGGLQAGDVGLGDVTLVLTGEFLPLPQGEEQQESRADQDGGACPEVMAASMNH